MGREDVEELGWHAANVREVAGDDDEGHGQLLRPLVERERRLVSSMAVL